MLRERAENQSYATKRQQNVKIFGLTPDDLLMGLRTDVDFETLTEDEVELFNLAKARWFVG